MAAMRRQGIEVQIGSYALHLHPAFRRSRRCRIAGDMAGSCHTFEDCLALPLYHDLSFKDQDVVIRKLRDVLGAEA
jgi:dTDP-4-amino-4,6-dideoxygalactose transaminase